MMLRTNARMFIFCQAIMHVGLDVRLHTTKLRDSLRLIFSGASAMYAVIQSGGKQYKVEPGSTVFVEKLPGDAGDAVKFDEVLLISNDEAVHVGRPLVEGATVTGEIVEHGRGKKLVVFKFKRRKNYRLRNGHRQDYTEVRIPNVVSA